MKKHKTYGFWISLSGATVLVIQIICDAFGVKIDSDEINQLISAICGILVMLGILIPDKANKNESIVSDVSDDNDKKSNDTYSIDENSIKSDNESLNKNNKISENNKSDKSRNK